MAKTRKNVFGNVEEKDVVEGDIGDYEKSKGSPYEDKNR